MALNSPIRASCSPRPALSPARDQATVDVARWEAGVGRERRADALSRSSCSTAPPWHEGSSSSAARIPAFHCTCSPPHRCFSAGSAAGMPPHRRSAVRTKGCGYAWAES
eukprot:689036-Rhodomonas_salina.2